MDRWDRVKKVFREAIELAPAEREDFVARACGDDDALRREVEALLAADDGAGSFLERPAAGLAALALADDGGQLAPGQRLGHFEVLSTLGAGGMGEVYLARDTTLGRRVALKLLPVRFGADPASVQRFKQEARAAAQLAHPNVCAIHEVGETEDGHRFIVMEYVEGETLRMRMARGRMALGEALAVAQQVAAALVAAHAVGIVHRDIKPENIMLRPDGYAKVVDFGLAKLIRHGEAVELETTTQTLVRTGSDRVMGSVAYLSPEQARAQVLDAQTDVWSLGVVLYETVAGSAPFTGATVADTMVAILDKEPLPLASHTPEVPAALEALVRRCLAKECEQRYPSAEELLTDLKSVAAQLSQSEAAARPSPSIAVLAFVNMSADPENEYFCDGLATELLHALAKIKALRVAARSSAFYFKGKNTNVQEIGRKLNVGAVLEGSVRKAGNRLRITAQLVNVADGYHLWSERYDREMEDAIDLQDEISQAIVDALKLNLLGAEKAAWRSATRTTRTRTNAA